MGKINKGILGGFSGKVGTVIGAFWKGIAYMRSLAGSTHNPKTVKQTKQRAKFALLYRFLSRIQGFINVGFKSMAVGMTEMNAAFSRNFDNVIGGDYPAYELLYDKVEVSVGSILLPTSPDAVIDAQVLTVSWTDNSGTDGARPTDDAMLLVYNSVKDQAVYSIAAGKRNEHQATLTLPSTWAGDSVDIWLSMRNDDNGKCSNSTYLGNFSI